MTPSKNLRLFGCVIMLLTIPLGLILRGFILSIIWRWFLVPLGLPEVSVALAIGIALTVSFLALKDSSDFRSGVDSVDEDEFATAIAKTLTQVFVLPFWLLLTAYVVHQFQ